ncbi:hypothetical protein F5Y16DRAFT_412758 [Xylariaceae sp. FL0255]|nr:hypothetical protein F5Y16DRAFT_412758 [Xylariaceae sp. FL0255]
MNNFGVIELASAKTTSAPGWAYVPDTRPGPHNLQAGGPSSTTTTNRKRARNAATGGGNLSLADANARQEAKFRREIEILDRDNATARDVQIAVPTKSRPANRFSASGNTEKKKAAAAAAAALAARKHGSNVRRILQSQKTFGNHLDDYVALQAQQDGATPGTGGGGGAAATGGSDATTAGLGKKPATTANSDKQQKQQQKEGEEDTEMANADERPKSKYLTPAPAAPSHEQDSNPLLASRLPPVPSDAEIAALLAAPPLNYLEARGSSSSSASYPARAFCAVCGYWGRVRCMKCGTRVCALDCLETHREECVTRYGI